ncbi:MAG: hypothetical protein N3A69_05185, partial [Leptospiraceae bacterium]|nr:hypothetical protein [Leptospiraceae bacterium]
YFSKAVDLNLNNKQKLTCLLKIIIYYNYHRAWNLVVHYTNRYLKIEQNPEIQKIRARAIANKGEDVPSPIITRNETKPQTNEKEKAKVSEKVAQKNKDSKEKTSKSNSSSNSEKKKSKEYLIWENVLKLTEKGNFKEAEKEISILLEKAPNNKNYLYKAGVIFYKLEKYSEALSSLESSLNECNSQDTQLLHYNYLYLGHVHYKTGRLLTAEEFYIKSFFYEFSVPALAAISRIRFELEDYQNVITLTSFLLKYEKTNPEIYMQRGVSLVKLGQRANGFQELLKFASLLKKEFPDLKKAPEKFHEGLLYLGVFYSNRSKYKLALKYLNLVSRTRNDRTSYQFALGKTYHYIGDFSNSIAHLEKIPNIPQAQYLIARFFALKKNVEQAKIYLAKAAKEKENYWVKVRLDGAFRELLNSSQEFSDFVTYRGNPPAAPQTKIE